MPRTVLTQKSYMPKAAELTKKWYLVDADGQVLGRLAVKLATALMGKDKPTYTAHMDTGDFYVVVNAEKVRVTGRKAEQLTYDWFTRHPGGRKVVPFEVMRAKHPERIIELAVRGMLPKNKLSRHLLKNLKVYAGPKHPHAAQQPAPLAV